MSEAISVSDALAFMRTPSNNKKLGSLRTLVMKAAAENMCEQLKKPIDFSPVAIGIFGVKGLGENTPVGGAVQVPPGLRLTVNAWVFLHVINAIVELQEEFANEECPTEWIDILVDSLPEALSELTSAYTVFTSRPATHVLTEFIKGSGRTFVAVDMIMQEGCSVYWPGFALHRKLARLYTQPPNNLVVLRGFLDYVRTLGDLCECPEWDEALDTLALRIPLDKRGGQTPEMIQVQAIVDIMSDAGLCVDQQAGTDCYPPVDNFIGVPRYKYHMLGLSAAYVALAKEPESGDPPSKPEP